MSDGFTGPDPARDDDDDGDDSPPLSGDFPAVPDDPGESDIGIEGYTLVTRDASCEKCVHRAVCAIYQSFAQTVENSFNEDISDGDPPVDPDKLAWHCREFEQEDGSEQQEATL